MRFLAILLALLSISVTASSDPVVFLQDSPDINLKGRFAYGMEQADALQLHPSQQLLAQAFLFNGTIVDRFGAPINNETHQQFVINRQGRWLLVTPEIIRITKSTSGKIIYHSTLSLREPVKFAGNALIKDGHLLSIDNFSGHYLPADLTPMQVFLSELKAHGIDISKAKVMFHTNLMISTQHGDSIYPITADTNTFLKMQFYDSMALPDILTQLAKISPNQDQAAVYLIQKGAVRGKLSSVELDIISRQLQIENSLAKRELDRLNTEAKELVASTFDEPFSTDVQVKLRLRHLLDSIQNLRLRNLGPCRQIFRKVS